MNNPSIQLKGIAVGNAQVSPYFQLPTLPKFAYDHHLITFLTYLKAKAEFFLLKKALFKDDYPEAITSFAKGIPMILGNPPYFNMYDIREFGDNYDPSHKIMREQTIGTYVNSTYMRGALGVGDAPFTLCNNQIFGKLFVKDHFESSKSEVEYLLKNNIDVLVYFGEMDFISNWVGGLKWINHIDWKFAHQFWRRSVKVWKWNGENVAEFKGFKNFHYVKVYNAGHFISDSKPEFASFLLQKFLKSKLPKN